MTRGSRPKPSSDLISDDILKQIKSVRPLRLFINKQKKKGSSDNPFTLRVRFCQLPREKQAKYLQRAVDRYIQILEEKDVDENVQIECKLFDYLLMRSEQKKYFESINAPIKPPGTAVPYYTQQLKQENSDDQEIGWKSLSLSERQCYKRMRKEAKAEYFAQVRNFAYDLPDRLRSDYLIFAGQLQHKQQPNQTASYNNSDDSSNSNTIRQRRKSLTALPDSLQTRNKTVENTQLKLNKIQLKDLHECMPSVIYYETNITDSDKPNFTKTMTKNAHMRTIFYQLDENDRLVYIIKSIEKWNNFLGRHPDVVEKQIPTLHLLLSRNEDILLYFSAVGLPQRPPINSYLLYNQERDEIGSQLTWSDLSEAQRSDYSQQLIELKNEYYTKMVEFVDNVLSSDYIRYEFFRNVKFAIKDYELALKNDNNDKVNGQTKTVNCFLKRIQMNNDKTRFIQIKENLFATGLTNEQKDLVGQLTDILYKYVH